ncbi:MAG: hypothetical protein JST17_05100 [Bacteroidetes bacterium]|nr:hypothetical protein [Bacteroidota bacterium]MBS1932035.1 hypothetical protein [Bacteroidota bacterium]
MRTKLIILTAIAVLLNISCNNNSKSPETKSKSKADSLMDDIMANHGTGMAKMNKISVVQGQMQHLLDSITGLHRGSNKENTVLKTDLDSLLAHLRSVESRMNQWMDEFNMDSLENKPEERIQYLESERQKTEMMKNDMISLLQKSDSLLVRKN